MSRRSRFLMWVMNLRVVSGSEALGKQEGTCASPLPGRDFAWKAKAAAKSPAKPSRSHHSQARHGANYQIANCNFLEDNCFLQFCRRPERSVAPQVRESKFEDPLRRGRDAPPRDLGFAGWQMPFRNRIFLAQPAGEKANLVAPQRGIKCPTLTSLHTSTGNAETLFQHVKPQKRRWVKCGGTDAPRVSRCVVLHPSYQQKRDHPRNSTLQSSPPWQPWLTRQ